jgi:preprotein translocase subunit SecA
MWYGLGMLLLEKVLRIGSNKRLRTYSQRVQAIQNWEEELQLSSDDELKERIIDIRGEIAEGGGLELFLVETFAIVREASRRHLGLRHFDVQMIGGMAMHEGAIAEMKTGEGKTLTATLPLVLNALSGQSVHLVTVNDYLARRDAEWMLPVYESLGLQVGILQSGADPKSKKQAYQADIIYGTNSEFGFDYLRDHLAWEREEQVQGGHAFAIVDEVDNILIDEARTPLIISGTPEGESDAYQTFAKIARQMVQGDRPEGYNPRLHRDWTADFDYEVDEKHKTVSVTEKGTAHVEKLLGIDHLYRAESSHLVNHLQQALKAESLYKKDKDYALIEGEVRIIDEFTGRILEGRRWSEGLHQAVEAKEGVAVQAENQTVASITYQNYFRRYEKLAGMTGTATTEATELMKIYNLEVVEIPPNRIFQREDQNDLIFATKNGKWQAVSQEIARLHERRQPVLVGTVSVADSEELSARLKKDKIPHNVLNAKPEYAQREGETIAQAGRAGGVTIATNMAGRGVDIKLGGGPEGLAEEALLDLNISPEDEDYQAKKDELLEDFAQQCAREAQEIKEAGGLAIVGTERHESRRIDNQLRGRSGRQGDPGQSRFYLSAEDDLLRLFGGDMMKKLLSSLQVDGQEAPLQHKMLSKRIEGAQKRVEEQRFLERKHVLEYDDVMNAQREAVYEWRGNLLEGNDLSEQLQERIRGVFEKTILEYTSGEYSEDWDKDGLLSRFVHLYPTQMTLTDLEMYNEREGILQAVIQEAQAIYAAREDKVGGEHMRKFERMLVLQVMDDKWREHLHDMDYLRDSIHLRGFAQIDPLVAYKNEAALMFESLVQNIWEQFTELIYRVDFEVYDSQGSTIASTRRIILADDSPKQPEIKLNRQQRRAQAKAGKKQARIK